jgi:uncharacterized protein YijF (DUF1287 family)
MRARDRDTDACRRRAWTARVVLCAAVVAGGFANSAAADEHAQRLVAAAREQTTQRVIYDGSYRAIDYPLGDVPRDSGVCTDVLIRAYRAALGVDLQVRVHEDMAASFSAYPQLWDARRPDRNIDHRRVPNLRRFFERAGAELPVTRTASDYAPGDIVSFRLPGNQPHIGIVSDRYVPGTRRRQMIHNIGAGPVEDDVLFELEITGHYRYLPE